MCQLYTSGSDTYLTADKQLQWKRGEHVQTKAEASNIDEGIRLKIWSVSALQQENQTYWSKIIENIALSFIRENKICRHSERATRDQGNESRYVRNSRETV